MFSFLNARQIKITKFLKSISFKKDEIKVPLSGTVFLRLKKSTKVSMRRKGELLKVLKHFIIKVIS